jgi:hypothetical protein
VRADRGRYVPNPAALSLSLDTDWSALAAAWYMEWERREAAARDPGHRAAAERLCDGQRPPQPAHGRHLAEPRRGEPGRRDGEAPVGHVWAGGGVRRAHCDAGVGGGGHGVAGEAFPQPSSIDDDNDRDGHDADQQNNNNNNNNNTIPRAFEAAWLDYCRFFNAPPAAQAARYGATFGFLKLRQGHSRLTAYAAARTRDDGLAARAWAEFADDADGFYPRGATRSTQLVPPTRALLRQGVEEAPWILTNIAALYGLAAIQNLAWIGRVLERGSLADGN